MSDQAFWAKGSAKASYPAKCLWIETCMLFNLQCGCSTSKLPVRGDPAVGYVVAAIEVRTLWCRPYADCFLHDYLPSLASMLQYPSVAPADGIALSL